MFLSTKIILNDIYNENNYCRMNEVNKNKNKQSILFFSILVLGGYLLAIWSIVILPLNISTEEKNAIERLDISFKK